MGKSKIPLKTYQRAAQRMEQEAVARLMDEFSLRNAFSDWWQAVGKYIDPDTEDVDWFDKRAGLCEFAFQAGIEFANSQIQTRKTRVDIKALLKNPKTRKRLLDGAVDFICKMEGIR